MVIGAFGYPSYWHSPWSFGIGFSFGYGYGGYGYGFGPYGYGPWGYGYAPWGYGYASPWYPYGPYYPYGYWMDGATSEVRIDAVRSARRCTSTAIALASWTITTACSSGCAWSPVSTSSCCT